MERAGEGLGPDPYGRAGDLDTADPSDDLGKHELEAPATSRRLSYTLGPAAQQHMGDHIFDHMTISCPAPPPPPSSTSQREARPRAHPRVRGTLRSLSGTIVG